MFISIFPLQRIFGWPNDLYIWMCYSVFKKNTHTHTHSSLHSLYYIDCYTFFQVIAECGYCIIIFHLEFKDFLPVTLQANLKKERVVVTT